MKRAIGFGIVALLLSGALITIAYTQATDTRDKAVTEKTNYEETVVQNLTLRNNGTTMTVYAGSGSNNSGPGMIPQGIEIPQSWRNISVEKHEPTEKDWMFLRDSMKDLSEEEKDKLLNEFKEIIEGRSTLSEEEQAEVCQKVGHYMIEATHPKTT